MVVAILFPTLRERKSSANILTTAAAGVIRKELALAAATQLPAT
jgi:hypothetical protein